MLTVSGERNGRCLLMHQAELKSLTSCFLFTFAKASLVWLSRIKQLGRLAI